MERFSKYHKARMVAQMVKNPPAMGWEDPRRKEQQPTPVFLPGESHGQRNLVVYSPWGYKESDMTEWLIHVYIFIRIPEGEEN